MKYNFKHLLLQAVFLLPLWRIFLLTPLLFLVLSPQASAQKRNAFLNGNSSNWGFVKNEGQIKSNAGNEIKCYGNFSNLQVFFYADKVEFIARKTRVASDKYPQPVARTASNDAENELPQETEMLVAKMVMNFQDYNTNSILELSGNSGSVNNFFLHGVQIRNAATFTQLRYTNIYPNTDLVFKADKNGLKYEFELRPGGEVNRIKLRWQGADISIKNGSLNYDCGIGKLHESQPISYISTGQKIPSSFTLKNNIVSFKTGKYPKDKTLTIDPLLHWSTYFGGQRAESANGVAVDSKGNVYMIGSTLSNSYIATSGAFRDTIAYATTNDIYLVKFSPLGKRIWSTYYGGVGHDYGDCITIDKNDNIYLGGYTGSLEYIATKGTYQTSNNGGGSGNKDGFLVKFDTSGKLVWGTYFGGEGIDGVRAITCDKFGDVYITGYTKSSKYIASANAHRTTMAGGGSGNNDPGGDAFLAKFNDKGKLKWATYFGGTASEQGAGVITDTDGNVIVAGQTASLSLIATTGSHQEDKAGATYNFDGFIAIFDSSGKLNWSTYYGGGADDYIEGITCDKNNNIYIGGSTNSGDNIAVKGAYMDKSRGDKDMFLARFSPDGKRSWGTYFGGNNLDDLRGIDISEANELFFTGSTISGGLQTKDAEKLHTDGFIDVISGKFDTSGKLIWASYYGGEGIDEVQGIAVQAKNTFFITGNTDSKKDIAVIGAYQQIGDGNADAFLVKYDTLGFCYGSPKPTIFGDTLTCEGVSNNYITEYYSQNKYRWEVTGGEIVFGKYDESVEIAWNSAGTKSLRVIRVNEYKCSDSTEITINVRTKPAADFVLSATNICMNDTVTVDAKTIGADYSWYWGDGNVSKNIASKHRYSSAGDYEIKLVVKSPEGCMDSTAQYITVNSLPQADFTTNKISALIYSLEADDTTYAKYTWQINGVTKYTTAKAKHNFGSIGTYNITLITENENGCKNIKDSALKIDPNSISPQQKDGFYAEINPNPFSVNTTIKISLEKQSSLQLGLYDASGRYILISKNALLPKGDYQYNLDAAALGLKPGIYMLYLTSGDEIFTKKLVVL
ncbi:MAG: T9SS type A sorting domain-containing protein [Sphingobacteriales bacterium]|nr:MAG: T9SS type A sorting domain-containing protein [Sphingobacteriales bacterium]